MNAIDEEIQTAWEEKEEIEDDEDENNMTASIIALSGFGLSVFFMWWAMLVLVRFYIFDNILYTIFMFSMLVTGIIFNVTSLNILLTEFREPIDFLPFIIGSPLTIFWTVFGLATSVIKKDFLPALAYIPMAEYDASFYDGLGYDPEVTKVHPFTKMFMNQSSIFLNTNLILVILFVMIVIETIFWIYATTFYVRLTKSIWSMRSRTRKNSKEL